MDRGVGGQVGVQMGGGQMDASSYIRMYIRVPGGWSWTELSWMALLLGFCPQFLLTGGGQQQCRRQSTDIRPSQVNWLGG